MEKAILHLVFEYKEFLKTYRRSYIVEFEYKSEQDLIVQVGQIILNETKKRDNKTVVFSNLIK